MSLRAKLFLLFGGLVAVLVVGQWFLIRTLTRDLQAEVGPLAVSVGREVLLAGTFSSGDGGAGICRFTFQSSGSESAAEGTAPSGSGKGNHTLVTRDADVKVMNLSGRGELRSVVLDRVELSVDRPSDARILIVQGPDSERREIPIPRLGMAEAVDRTFGRFFFGSMTILILGLLAAGVVAHRVSAPLRGLATAARLVGEGQLGAQAPVRGGGEVGSALASFNRMSLRLKELEAAARELRARRHLSEIGEVGRGLAHSLRNHLNALGLALEELVAGASGSARSADLLEGARRQIRRADQAIRSFLALASESGGQVEEMPLLPLVQDVVLEAIQGNPGRAAVVIEEPGEGPVIRGAAPELRAAIQALLINAVEATPAGGTVRIHFASPPPGCRTRLVIEDEGPGIAPEVRRRLFTPHVTTKANGSGMGLFLAQRIASTRYGGGLALEDRDPSGTRAVLDLSDRRGAELDQDGHV
ncbi:MAG: ATP-binding protein [Acidobacteriota bacterium]